MSQQVAGSQQGPPVPAERGKHGCQKQIQFLLLCYAGLGHKHGGERHTRWSSCLKKRTLEKWLWGMTVSTCYLRMAKPVSKKPLVLL